MPRKTIPQISPHPIHITCRHHNREQFPIPLTDVWSIFESALYLMTVKYNLKIHSFVLMPNHFHLIASSSEFEVGKILCELLTFTSKEINFYSGKTNQVWGKRNHKSILKNYFYFLNAYKYVYQNPVRAKLVEKAQDWKYSTLNGILGFSKLVIPIQEDTILFNPLFDDSELEWINCKIDTEDLEDFRLALKKSVFQLIKDSNRKVHRLASQRI